MSSVPTFATRRLFLKEMTMLDVVACQRHINDYEVLRNLSYKIPWPYPDNGAEDFIENVVIPNQGNDRWIWGIYRKNNPNEMIGCIDLFREGETENRGFWLSRAFWSRGIMTEAIQPTLEYAFDTLGFEKLKFANAVGNQASRRIKETTGCQYMGKAPGKFVDPQIKERELWELTKENWEAHKSENK